MSKRSPSENLKSFSIIYIILIVVYIIGALLCNFVPEVANLFKGSAESKDVLLAINISGLVNAFMQKGFSFLTLDVIVDILGLYYLLQVRKEK